MFPITTWLRAASTHPSGRGFTARFEPHGLAFSSDGRVLYVADTRNHRIRAVFLDESNRVGTLAGTGERLSRDGSRAGGRFDSPATRHLSGDRLLVVGGRIRIVDLTRLRFDPKLKGENAGLFAVPRTSLSRAAAS
jgi:hypothetical protein